VRSEGDLGTEKTHFHPTVVKTKQLGKENEAIYLNLL
jgi:hypothetical protein